MLLSFTTILLRLTEDIIVIFFEISFKKHLLYAYYVPSTMLGTDA